MTEKYIVSQEFMNDLENCKDENGGHGHMEFGCIGSAIVQVFYADDEGCK